jgi:hypothetical protein
LTKEIVRSILSLVPSITTRIGLLAFAVAVVAIVYVVVIHEKRKTLRELPLDKRSEVVLDALTKYNLTFGKATSDDAKVILVLQEMKQKATRNLAILFAGAFVFLACFAMISFGSVPPKPNPPKADEGSRVVGYKRDILALRDDAEARAEGWKQSVRDTGIHLAKWIGQVPEGHLTPGQAITKHEYRGFALLMVANTFDAESPSARDYAASACEEFAMAVRKMQEISRDVTAGKQDLTPVFEWMTGPSEDLNRTHYLQAIALAVIARAGGGTKPAVVNELNLVDREYQSKYPPMNNPDLAWALRP